MVENLCKPLENLSHFNGNYCATVLSMFRGPIYLYNYYVLLTICTGIIYVPVHSVCRNILDHQTSQTLTLCIISVSSLYCCSGSWVASPVGASPVGCQCIDLRCNNCIQCIIRRMCRVIWYLRWMQLMLY